MSLVQSVKTLADEETNKNLLSSNSTLLQKRLQLLAPSDDSDSETDSDEQITPKKETPTRHNRSNSWLNWFSWYSNTTKPKVLDSPPTPETSTPKHEISSPYQVEHTIHLDLSPESSSTSANNSIKDISILIFEQKERIKDLQRDNDLKDEYIKQLEAKVREMHEQKMFAKERYNKLKYQYDELAERTTSNGMMWNSVASSVLGRSIDNASEKSIVDDGEKRNNSYHQHEEEEEDDSSCFTSPLKRNANNNILLSPTPDLDALLDKMGLDD